MHLYRPVGLAELEKIFDAHMRAFPPRLPEQPIFYPVLNAGYAAQIARAWNTKQAPYAGYVTAFAVDERYAARFERRVVGNQTHEELWVPAEQLGAFNQHIHGPIQVIDAFFGPAFAGHIPAHGPLKGQPARQQLLTLARLQAAGEAELRRAVESNQKALLLHLPFWQRQDFAPDGLDGGERQRLLAALRAAWQAAVPSIALPL